MCWPPSAGQLWPGIAVAKNCLCCGTFCTAVVLPLCAAKFLHLCLLVALTPSAILWRYLFRRVILPAVWSLFFLHLLLYLILCLSLLFVAPPSAHFCKLSFFSSWKVFLRFVKGLNFSLIPSSPKESFHISLRLSSNPYVCMYVCIILTVHVRKSGPWKQVVAFNGGRFSQVLPYIEIDLFHRYAKVCQQCANCPPNSTCNWQLGESPFLILWKQKGRVFNWSIQKAW